MNLHNPDIDALVKMGCTKRMAKEYLNIVDSEKKSGLYDTDYMSWAHEHGFYAESACAYRLNDTNVDDYLSDFDNCRLWPLNSWQRIWINDKLTLHTLVSGSKLARYLPEYYYYTEKDRLVPLDGSGYRPGIKGFLDTLQEKGSFACKPSNGALAAGFHTLEYAGRVYMIDGSPVSESEVRNFVHTHSNCIFTEYLLPEKTLAPINDLIHTLRVLVINPTGYDPTVTLGYLRFAGCEGNFSSGANYAEGSASFNVRIDLRTGTFNDGVIIGPNQVRQSPCHPTSGVLAKGVFPYFEEALNMLREFSLKVGACEYLGFDICASTNGLKIMEINSHTGIKYIQAFNAIMRDTVLEPYFREKLARLDCLSGDELALRAAIAR